MKTGKTGDDVYFDVDIRLGYLCVYRNGGTPFTEYKDFLTFDLKRLDVKRPDVIFDMLLDSEDVDGWFFLERDYDLYTGWELEQ